MTKSNKYQPLKKSELPLDTAGFTFDGEDSKHPNVTDRSPHSTGEDESKPDSRKSEDVSTTDEKPQDDSDMLAKALRRLLLDAYKNKDSDKEDAPPEFSIDLPSGMGFRRRERTNDEIVLGRVIIKRSDRGSTPEARKKLRDRVCVALDHKLSLTKWDDILDSSADLDLGSAVISVQTQLDCLVEFTVVTDIFYLGNVPMGVNMWNEYELSRCKNWVNILTDYQQISLDLAKEYQALINCHGLQVDMESSEWLYAEIEKSTDKPLWQMVKQTYDTFERAEKGGISMFKLIVDKIDNPSFEQLQCGVNFILTFKLSNTPGENVSIAILRFSAVVRSLPASSVPPTTVQFFLEGMMFCSSDSFKEVVSAQRGMLYTSVGKALLKDQTMLQQIETVSAPLEEKYLALITQGAWGGVAAKASSFKAIEQKHSTPAKKKHKYPTKEAWFDNCECGTCGVKGHPTYAHENPSFFRKQLSSPTRPANPKTTSDQKKKFRSLIKKDRTKVLEKAHNILCDMAAESESEEEAEEQVHVADGDVGDSAFNGEDHDDDDDLDAGVDALVAATLTNLLKE